MVRLSAWLATVSYSVQLIVPSPLRICSVHVSAPVPAQTLGGGPASPASPASAFVDGPPASALVGGPASSRGTPASSGCPESPAVGWSSFRLLLPQAHANANPTPTKRTRSFHA